MAPHVSLQGIATGMRQALSVAASPFARVLFLTVLNVRIVNVLNQLVHVALVSCRAAVPVADGDLVLEVFLLQPGVDGGARDVA